MSDRKRAATGGKEEAEPSEVSSSDDDVFENIVEYNSDDDDDDDDDDIRVQQIDEFLPMVFSNVVREYLLIVRMFYKKARKDEKKEQE
jgi:hypothetical protein